MHAACGSIGGQAYIFTGKPDSGKSTALKNLGPEKTISEDILAIKPENKEALVFSTPFRQEKNHQAKAKAIFFPKKSKGLPKINPENIAYGAAEIIANTMFSTPYDAPLISLVTKNIIIFCNYIPSFSLYFPKKGCLRKTIL